MWTVVGQERVVAELEKAVRAGRLHHAYLLVGPPRVGKLALARDLARAVNCTGEAPPCGECSQCRRIGAGLHADVQVIGLDGGGERPRAEIGIDAVRDMERAASLLPFEGKCRVFVIDGAEHLSEEAANALLKTLEEPPTRVLLVLLTAHAQDLPPTVTSRCQRVELRPLPWERVEALLRERYGLSEEQAREVARLSLGCPGWAVEAARDPGLLQRRSARLDVIAALAEAPLGERFAYAEEVARTFQRQRAAAREELFLWLRWWRDVMLVQAGLEEHIAHRQRAEELRRHAERCSKAQVASFLRVVLNTLETLDRNASPRLALEVMMLEMPGLTHGLSRPGVKA
ncbi:MAG: DNA polymerase III subunit [Chloroflexi bacterium]|nr:DNA polymerase III subunit [Chloroflexota bacterium]